MDKVSVIIPFYNEENYIKECIDSVLNQEYKNIEIILINNKSNDGTLDIISKIKDKRIKVYNCNKRGVSFARNKGIKEATGRFICFLDADDYWESNKLNKQIKFMKENSCYFTYTDYIYLKKGNEKRVKVPQKLTYSEALKNTTIFTSTVIIDTKYVDKKLIKMPPLKMGEDTATWWQILKTGVIGYGMNDIVSFYRIKKNSLSSNKLKAVLRTWKIYKLQDISLIKKIICFVCYIINAIKRRI